MHVSRLPHERQIGGLMCRTEVKYLQSTRTQQRAMTTGTTNLGQEISHPLEDWICYRLPKPLVELSGNLENIIGRAPPFVHPMATTPLFAQSNDQQFVSCSSMRSTGSTFTGLAVSCVKNGRPEGTSFLTMNWPSVVLRLKVPCMRNHKHGERAILEGSSK